MTVAVAAPATWVAVKGGNDLYWRVEAPARVIGAKTLIIPEEDAYRSLTQPNDGEHFPWRETPEGSEYPAHEGASVVFTRPDLARATHGLALSRLHGVRTVAEVDDNYISDPKHNIFLRVNGMDDVGRLDHLKATASMDAVVFSTGWLRDTYHRRFRKQFGRKGIPELHVARNHVDDRDWPVRVERDGPLRVGWMGSPSHIWDIDLAYNALRWASDQGHEVWLIGYDPANPSGAGLRPDDVDEQSARSRHKIGQWRKVTYRYVPWMEPSKYHRTPLPLDIGLCPLLTNNHTLGKSDVKFLEYAISGAATVAQGNLVYNRTVRHGETGFLASGPEEFLRYTQLLCRDSRLRERMVESAQQYVREERSLQKNIGEWKAAIAA